MRAKLFAFALVGLFAIPVFSQTTTTSGTSASVLVQRSFLALTGGKTVSDVTLTATENRTEGSLQSLGAVTLSAYGQWDSRVQDAKGVELRNHPSGPAGSWTDNQGSTRAAASHNCATDAVWFFPALLSLYSGDPDVNVIYVGHETWNGNGVEHLATYRKLANAAGTEDQVAEGLTRVDVYLDSASYLPVRSTFFAHPDNDFSSNLAVEIRYSQYQNSAGALIPFHVQRYLQGTLFQDITITTVALNAGLSDANFQN